MSETLVPSLYQDEMEVLASPEDFEAKLKEETEELASAITKIVESLDTQERVTRDRMLRLWKYLELLWSGAGNYYWDHNTGQWRAVTQEDLALLSSDADIDPTLMNKTINIIRPYGESLAGVLTTGIPRVRYYPEDADNDLDIQASRGYSDVEKKINDDNNIQLKLIEIIVKLWNGGFAAAYNYTHSDKEYGTYTESVFGNRDFSAQSLICTLCGNEQVINETEIPEKTETSPENLDSASTEEAPETDLSHPEMQMPDLELQESEMPSTIPNLCPQCMAETPHILTPITTTKEVEIGQNELPRSRQIINVYGPLNVKISALATRKEHIFWLVLEEELDVAYAKFLYPDHKEKIAATTTSSLDVDRLARSNIEIGDDLLKESATIRKVWLKPAAYEKLSLELASKLASKYPNGIMAVFCADVFLEAEEENLDDHWTVSINPLYSRVQADPLGKALIGCHEVANDLFQLEVDAVRYSVPITFADPQYFDFEAYRQTRVLPGSVSPMKKPPGGKLSDNLAESKTSTLPQGIEYLDIKLEKLIQFISGVLPSVFGGSLGTDASKTLGVYQESKNQALQRLSIIWKIVSVMYSEMMAKSTKQYVDSLREDERFVRPNGKDGFINVWLRRETLQGGKIGKVRAELSEQFPTTWAQISARVMELLQLNNEAIFAWFLHPENVELVYKVLGIDGIYIPGEDQRNKQLYEIGEIIQASMPVTDPMTGATIPNPIPYVHPVEPIDNHQIHMEVISAWLNSPMGIDMKNVNPNGYNNIMQHYQLHAGEFAIQQQAQMEQAKAMEPKKGQDTSDSVEEANA